MSALLLALLVSSAPVDPALLPGSPRAMVGHAGSVVAVTFAADGKTMASAGFDKTVRIWDVATGKELLKLSGPKASISSVAFSPDGKLIAAGDAGLAVTLWSLPDGKVVRVMHNAEPLAHVVFSRDGKLLAGGGISGTSEVFAVADGKELYEVRVRTPEFTRDGSAIIGTNKLGAVVQYDAANGKQKKELKGTRPTSSLLSADSKQLFAYSGNDKEVIVIDASTGTSLGTFSGATAGISSVATSADGALFAAASEDKTVRVYDAATRTLLRKFPLEKVGFVAFSPDKSLLAVGDGVMVKLFQVPAGAQKDKP